MKREPARTFEDLIVWQKAHAFVLGVYRLSSEFPREEIYGLTSQLRRAADLGYPVKPQLANDATEVGRLLGSYARTLLSPSS